MHSSFTAPSRFLSSISLALLLAACPNGGDDCGVGDAPASPINATNGTDITLAYENLSSLAGNDCPDAAAPSGVVSLSIEGTQIGNPGGRLTFCTGRPDLLKNGRALGTTQSMGEIRIIDFSGAANGCTFTLDSSMPPTGTAKGTGVCKNGTDAAGFALEITGTVNLRRTCGMAIDSVALTLSGKVAVTSRDN
jgi:hypothetical protein